MLMIRGRAVSRRFARGVLAVVLLNAAMVTAAALDVEITTLNGTPIQGKLIRVSPGITIAGDGKETTLDWTEILELTPLGNDAAAIPATANPLRFSLADGSVFGGRVDAVDGSTIIVRFRSGQTANVPRGALAWVESTSASERADELVKAAISDGERTEDVAVVERDGKVVELRGAVRAITASGIAFTWHDRDRTLPWDLLAGLVLTPPSPRASECSILLHDGDAFAGRITGGSDAALVLESSVLDRFSIAWERIERIECRSDRLVFLSDVRPTSYRFEPMFEKRWDYARDKTLLGTPIQLAGRRYARGLTMHSRSVLQYEIGGRFRQFAALAGIVDDMADRGDARIAVLGDDQLLWKFDQVRGGQPPTNVLVDIEGVHKLELVVDYGEDLDLSDQVAWALARLIR